MIPFAPQPKDQLAARYKAALEVPYDALTLQADDIDRSNVFDFVDGLRLTVAIVAFPNRCWLLAITASAQADPIRRATAQGRMSRPMLERIALGSLRAIAGKEVQLDFEMHSADGPGWGAVLTGAFPTDGEMAGWGLSR